MYFKSRHKEHDGGTKNTKKHSLLCKILFALCGNSDHRYTLYQKDTFKLNVILLVEG